jgi:hypothetical protein
MASVASPYGLRPVNMLGGAPMVHGMREIKVSTNNSAAIFSGDIIILSAAGNPSAATATPTAGTTAGIVGVCVGVRYALPAASGGAYMWGQYLPANAITNGYTDAWVLVADDPNTVFKVQGSAAFGTLTNGSHGAIGKNAALGNFSAGSTVTGNSGVNLTVGTNGASLAATATLAVRIVGVMPGTESDTYPELLVKFNGTTHSYNFATGV